MSGLLTVVIAAYDEVDNVGELVRRLGAVLRSLPQLESAVVFVVEGQDGTRERLHELAGELPRLRVLYQAEPSGLGAAFRRGFAAVSPDCELVVTMDADLNHRPEEIPELLAALDQEGADVVIGSRFVSGGESRGTPLWKRVLSGSINRLMRLMFGLKVRDKTSGFRVYRWPALRQLEYQNRDFAFLPEILILAQRQGFTMVERPIRFVFRTRGHSKMGFVTTSLSYLRLFAQRFSATSL